MTLEYELAREGIEREIEILFRDIKRAHKPDVFRKLKRRYCRLQAEYSRDYGFFYHHYLEKQ